MNKDLDHLKILGILHTIWGVLAILFGLLFGSFLIVVASAGTIEVSGNMTPETGRGIFVVAGIAAIVLSSIYGIMVMMAGGKLRKQGGYGFCFFVSILNLFSCPGLFLGIFTLIVLMRPTVKELFKGGSARPPLQSAQTVSQAV